MPNTLLDPKNDFVFKKLFAESPDLLADLINAVRSGEDPIEVIKVLNPRIDPEELTGKFIILDVLARDTRGRAWHDETSFLADARREGLAEGRAAMLFRLLTLKFGELPIEFQQRLHQVNEAELDSWAASILFADSLEAVFR